MATSGSFLTSDSGQGDSQFYGRTRFYWWRTDWGRTSSVGWHKISYNLKTYGGQSNYWQYFYNGSMNVDGTGYTFSSPIQAYGDGATNLSGTKSKTLYTNSSGDRSFNASARGGIYTSAINTTGSGSWSLNNIPMYGGISSVLPASGITDETGSISVNWYKYTGRAALWFRLDQIDNGDTTHRYLNVTSDPYSWTGWETWLQQSMVNTNSTTLYIYYGDDLDSNGSVDHYNSAVTRTITIANDSGQANPTFADFDYEDTNSTTAAVTGNNQILIQGKSTLEVTVAAADAATTNKNAARDSYVFTIGGYSDSEPWPASGDVVHTIGAVSDVTGTRNLSVEAVDSRSNKKTVTKSVNILPYSSPAFVPDLDVKYTNDFDTSDGLTVEVTGSKIASVSPLTVGGTDKNSVNGTSGVRFDISKGNNTSYTGSWENVATSFGTNTGDITATIATLQSDILTKMNGLTADNTVKWYVKFEITDALETTYYETEIGIGKPIFRIGTDGNLYNNERLMSSFVNTYYYKYDGTDITINGTSQSNGSNSISWTKPENLKFIEVEVIGGGGAGGGAQATSAGQSSAGGGGGGGEYAKSRINADSLGSSETVTIGTGGAGGSASAGGDGSSSSFGTHVTANGGSGGAIRSAVNQMSGTNGGNGGTGGTGDFKVSGVPGGYTEVVQGSTRGTGGYGGGTYFGGGTTAHYNSSAGGSVAGINASNPGDGGSGAQNGESSSARAGGDGASGIVIIREYF